LRCCKAFGRNVIYQAISTKKEKGETIMYDLIIKNGTVVSPSSSVTCDVAIKEKIAVLDFMRVKR
jgi:hypothetical protein